MAGLGHLITARVHTKLLLLQFLPAFFNLSQVKAIHEQKESVTPKIHPVKKVIVIFRTQVIGLTKPSEGTLHGHTAVLK